VKPTYKYPTIVLEEQDHISDKKSLW